MYDLNPVEFDQNIERVIKFINTKIIENKSHENKSDEKEDTEICVVCAPPCTISHYLLLTRNNQWPIIMIC